MVARLPPEFRVFSRVPASLSSALRIGSRSRPGARLPCEPRVAPGSKRGSLRVPDRALGPFDRLGPQSPRGSCLLGEQPSVCPPRLLPAALWASSPLRPPCGSCLRGDPQVLPPPGPSVVLRAPRSPCGSALSATLGPPASPQLLPAVLRLRRPPGRPVGPALLRPPSPQSPCGTDSRPFRPSCGFRHWGEFGSGHSLRAPEECFT